MKKFNLYFWFIALIGLITSCSQDETAGLQTVESSQVCIGASINGAVQTRAESSFEIPAGCKLRYVLEVWDNTGTTLKHRAEELKTDVSAVDFTFTLTDAGNYKALLWADFVTNETGSNVNADGNVATYIHYADVHYTTNTAGSGLKAVTLAKTGTNYVINNESRDAFFACKLIKKDVGAFVENVELKRPFGQINVIEKNTELLTKVATMTLTYNVPKTFNVFDGSVDATVAVNPTVTSLATVDGDRKANLFYDFIFAPATGQTLLGSIAMTFISTDAPSTTISAFTIPANMPVERNKRTNISGSILSEKSSSAKLSVTVSPDWSTPEEEKDVDPKVGDYYYKDGTWSTEAEATTENPIIGVVYLLSTDGKSRGKVVSLKEGKGQWSTATETTNVNTNVSGKANTEKILAYEASTLANYPIFETCKSLRTTDDAEWYIPVSGEYISLLKTITKISPIIKAQNGTEIVMPVESSANTYYWQSRESTVTTTANAMVTTCNDGANAATKNTEHKVRYILDF